MTFEKKIFKLAKKIKTALKSQPIFKEFFEEEEGQKGEFKM